MAISGASISYKGLTGHWTKYGGRVYDPIGRQDEDFSNWYCQSCHREMTEEMPPYMYEFPEKEYIRVCAICVSNDCKTLKIRMEISEVELEL